MYYLSNQTQNSRKNTNGCNADGCNTKTHRSTHAKVQTMRSPWGAVQLPNQACSFWIPHIGLQSFVFNNPDVDNP